MHVSIKKKSFTFLVTYGRLLQLFSPFKLCLLLTADCNLTFRSSSIESTNDEKNHLHAQHFFFFFDNLFHSNVLHNMEEMACHYFCYQWRKSKLRFFSHTSMSIISLSLHKNFTNVLYTFIHVFYE